MFKTPSENNLYQNCRKPVFVSNTRVCQTFHQILPRRVVKTPSWWSNSQPKTWDMDSVTLVDRTILMVHWFFFSFRCSIKLCTCHWSGNRIHENEENLKVLHHVWSLVDGPEGHKNNRFLGWPFNNDHEILGMVPQIFTCSVRWTAAIFACRPFVWKLCHATHGRWWKLKWQQLILDCGNRLRTPTDRFTLPDWQVCTNIYIKTPVVVGTKNSCKSVVFVSVFATSVCFVTRVYKVLCKNTHLKLKSWCEEKNLQIKTHAQVPSYKMQSYS